MYDKNKSEKCIVVFFNEKIFTVFRRKRMKSAKFHSVKYEEYVQSAEKLIL